MSAMEVTIHDSSGDSNKQPLSTENTGEEVKPVVLSHSSKVYGDEIIETESVCKLEITETENIGEENAEIEKNVPKLENSKTDQTSSKLDTSEAGNICDENAEVPKIFSFLETSETENNVPKLEAEAELTIETSEIKKIGGENAKIPKKVSFQETTETEKIGNENSKILKKVSFLETAETEKNEDENSKILKKVSFLETTESENIFDENAEAEQFVPKLENAETDQINSKLETSEMENVAETEKNVSELETKTEQMDSKLKSIEAPEMSKLEQLEKKLEKQQQGSNKTVSEQKEKQPIKKVHKVEYTTSNGRKWCRMVNEPNNVKTDKPTSKAELPAEPISIPVTKTFDEPKSTNIAKLNSILESFLGVDNIKANQLEIMPDLLDFPDFYKRLDVPLPNKPNASKMSSQAAIIRPKKKVAQQNKTPVNKTPQPNKTPVKVRQKNNNIDKMNSILENFIALPDMPDLNRMPSQVAVFRPRKNVAHPYKIGANKGPVQQDMARVKPNKKVAQLTRNEKSQMDSQPPRQMRRQRRPPNKMVAKPRKKPTNSNLCKYEVTAASGTKWYKMLEKPKVEVKETNAVAPRSNKVECKEIFSNLGLDEVIVDLQKVPQRKLEARKQFWRETDDSRRGNSSVGERGEGNRLPSPPQFKVSLPQWSTFRPQWST